MIQQRFSHQDFARPLFRDTVAMAWADPTAPMPRLLGDEVLAIDHVAPARAREFAAGRYAARLAMEQLGHAPRPILQGQDRAPVWPHGLTGSITHTRQDCLAVVTDDPDIAALGLDMEPACPMGPDLWRDILTPEDMYWLGGLGPTQRGHFATLIFSAKEAFYKAQYQISQTMLEFCDVDLTPDLTRQCFVARLRKSVPGLPEGTCIEGRFALLGNAIITTVEIPA